MSDKKGFTYDIEDHGHVPTEIGSNVRIALDPEKKEIYSYDSGNGCPGNIFHNVHISIFNPPHRYVPESLIRFFKSEPVQAILKKIMVSYDGTKWDGSNHVGKWASTDDSMCDFEYHCHELESLGDDIECYWDAENFCDDHNAIRDMIAGCKTIEESAEEIVDQAEHCGIVLSNNDVISWLAENIYNEGE